MKPLARLGAVVATAAGFILLTALPAMADGGSVDSGMGGFMKAEDRNGISQWAYQLSLDQGSATNPWNTIWAFFLKLGWSIYQQWVAFSIWLMDWVLSFKWLELLTAPFTALATGLHSVVTAFGVVPCLLTLTVVIAMIQFMRGRTVLSIYQIGMSLVIASLATGVLAQPVQLVSGDGGLIVKARDIGLEISQSLADADPNQTGSACPPTGDQWRECSRAAVKTQMVETFIRAPQQMINFGQIVPEGPECRDKYDDALKNKPGDIDAIRDSLADCEDGKLKEFADNPGPQQAMMLYALFPSIFLICGFAIAISVGIFLAAFLALWNALKLVVTLVTGLVPGVSRGGLWLSVSNIAVSLAELIFAVVFLTAYLQVIKSVFEGSADDLAGRMETFYFVDLLLFAGIIVYWRQRRRLRKSADRMAMMMGTQPGGGRQQLPEKGPGLWHSAKEVGTAAYGGYVLGKKINNMLPDRKTGIPVSAPPPANQRQSVDTGTGGGPTTSWVGPNPPTSSDPFKPTGPQPAGAPGGGGKGPAPASAKATAGAAAASTVTKLGLAAMTGGSSTVATAAVSGAAKRAAVTQTLNAAKAAGKGSSTAPSTTGPTASTGKPAGAGTPAKVSVPPLKDSDKPYGWDHYQEHHVGPQLQREAAQKRSRAADTRRAEAAAGDHRRLQEILAARRAQTGASAPRNLVKYSVKG